MALKRLKKGLEAGAQSLGARISTRVPTAQRATENALTEDLQIDIPAMLAGGEAGFAKNAKIVGQQARTRLRTAPGRTQAFLDMGVDNLMWLHALVPAEVRVATRDWYKGANRMAREMSETYGVSGEASSAVLAALSPQKDWYQNVSLAERVMDTMKQISGNYRFPDKEHLKKATELYTRRNKKEKDAPFKARLKRARADLKAMKENPFEALTPNQKAMFVRSFDEAFNDRGYDVIDPTGERTGAKLKKDGSPSTAAWGSNSEIAKAIGVIEDPSIENISSSMGLQHKVRNFYNNISNPEHSVDIPELGDITIDTHAVAALLMRPVSGNSPEVSANFGTLKGSASSAFTGASGTYGINADAYRTAAKELGIQPRQLQSVTWDAIRNIFPQTLKNNAGDVANIEAVWDLHKRGKLSLNDARTIVVEKAGGLREPDWIARPESGVLVPRTAGVDRRAGLVAAGMPAVWLTGTLTSEDAQATALETAKPRTPVDPQQFKDQLDRLEGVGADVDLVGNNTNPRITNAVSALSGQPVEQPVQSEPPGFLDEIGTAIEDFATRRLNTDVFPEHLRNEVSSVAGGLETGAAVALGIGGGLVGDASRLGGLLAFRDIDEVEAGAQALEENISSIFTPSDNARGGEFLQQMLDQAGEEADQAERLLNPGESIPGQIFKGLPRRAQEILKIFSPI